MFRSRTLVLACTLALIVGCASNKKKPTTQATGVLQTTEQTAAAPAPAVPTETLAGSWQLAIPRQNQRQASITLIDETHVKIDAGDKLSGDYVVQGKYLLILTHDEQLRPLAWKINSPDSLTIVRSFETSDGSSGYMGVTMVRAADSTASTTESK